MPITFITLGDILKISESTLVIEKGEGFSIEVIMTIDPARISFWEFSDEFLNTYVTNIYTDAAANRIHVGIMDSCLEHHNGFKRHFGHYPWGYCEKCGKVEGKND